MQQDRLSGDYNMSAPSIQTDRLILRGYTKEDWPALVALWADPAVVRYFGGEPVPPEEVWSKLAAKVGLWSLLGFGFWILEDRETGEVVGEAGFLNMKRKLEIPFGDAPEIGWILRGDRHGKGYASEAVAAILAWGLERFGPVRSVCLIHEENAPSLRLASRFGYTEFARSEYKGGPCVLLHRML